MATRSSELHATVRPVIGFTVGVWDLFHEGHKAMLEDCKKRCTVLIVGIMTDRWVRIQKGRDAEWNLSRRINEVGQYPGIHGCVVLDTIDIHQSVAMCDLYMLGHDQYNLNPNAEDPRAIRLPKHGDVTTTSLLEKGPSS